MASYKASFQGTCQSKNKRECLRKDVARQQSHYGKSESKKATRTLRRQKPEKEE